MPIHPVRGRSSAGAFLMGVVAALMRDSIKLNDGERRALLERLALHDAVSLERSSREHKRLKVPSNITIEVVLTHPGGGEVHVRAVVKDVSKTGLGMLYGGFLHHGTRVAVRFIGDDRNALIVQGARVVRCVHVQGPVHDVGMRFDAEVPVDSLFGLVDDRAADDDPNAGAYAELDASCAELHRLIRSRHDFSKIAEAARKLGEAAEKERKAQRAE
ncbi:MAG: PilZ domain-containing protein [Phycisphaerales bacterium]|jgi:hypothetical protein|nr:PilZ domain-containing protein [Phycisphaerales bacterium]